MVKTFITCIVFILFLNIFCFTDAGGYEINGSGGAVFPVKSEAIIMEKEIINIDVYREDSYYYRLEYDCVFYFKNTENKEQKILAGFPDRPYQIAELTLGGDEIGESNIQNFKFIVDEKEVQHKVYSGTFNPGNPFVPGYSTVYTAEVVFAPEEQKIIKNTFTMYRNQGYTVLPRGPAGGSTEPDYNDIYYILLTAKTWKGSIGEADIFITFHFPGDFLHIYGYPSGYEIKTNPYQAYYHFLDFIPEEDIVFNFYFRVLTVEEQKQASDYYNKGDYGKSISFSVPISVNKAVPVIDDYWNNGNFEDAIVSLKILDDIIYAEMSQFLDALRWEEEPVSDIDTVRKTIKKSWDLIRKSAYFKAGKIYKKDLEKAIELYYIAFYYTYKTDIFDDFFLTNNFKPGEFPDKHWEYKFDSWVHEGENNAPCYYIAYNLACAYSLTFEYTLSDKWLNAAFKMNPKLEKMAKKDKDLENYWNWKKLVK